MLLHQHDDQVWEHGHLFEGCEEDVWFCVHIGRVLGWMMEQNDSLFYLVLEHQLDSALVGAIEGMVECLAAP